MRWIPCPLAIPLVATLSLLFVSPQARAQTESAGRPVAPSHLADEFSATTISDRAGGAFIGFRARAAVFFFDQPASFVAHVDANGDTVPGWNVVEIGKLSNSGYVPVHIATVEPGRAWLVPDFYFLGATNTPLVARPVGEFGPTVPDSSVDAGRTYEFNSLAALPTGRLLITGRADGGELRLAFIEPDGSVTEGGAPIVFPTGWGSSTLASYYSGPLAIPDGGAGAWVLWQVASPAPNASDIAIVRVAADGSPLTVRNICTATNDQGQSVMCPDDAEGVFVAWADARDFSKSLDLYAAHLLADGNRAPGWGPQGNAIASFSGDQFMPQIVADGSGGAWLAWTDSRSGENDIYYTHVGANGAPKAGFPVGGKPLCAAAGSQLDPQVVADGEGGFFTVWLDGRDGGIDVFAQHIHSTGVVMPGWPSDGAAVCTEGTDQGSPALVLTSPHHALATWVDRRAGYPKVYAAALPPDGAVAGTSPRVPPAAFSIETARDPARGDIELIVSTPVQGEVRVTLHDVAGRVLGERVIEDPGVRATVRFAATDLKPGLYFARASRAGQVTTTRISLVR